MTLHVATACFSQTVVCRLGGGWFCFVVWATAGALPNHLTQEGHTNQRFRGVGDGQRFVMHP